MKTASIILAAGKGTRMRSRIPKVLHPLAGKPMIDFAVRAASEVVAGKPFVIIGYGSEEVRQYLSATAHCIVQEKQLGTGHAVLQAEETLKDKSDHILVTNGDMPLLHGPLLRELMAVHKKQKNPVTMLVAENDHARGFGRVIRDTKGRVTRILEEAHATYEERAIRELNVGVYCFNSPWLWEALHKIKISPKGEYYLTDLIEIAVQQGQNISTLKTSDPDDVIGINTRVHLAEAERIMRRRILTHWMESGVTVVDPSTTYIDLDVSIGTDTTIHPGTSLIGNTVVGERCELGPNTIIRNTTVGDDCKILASVLEDAKLEDHVDVGPFGHLRKGAHLASGVHVGNFGEVKDSYVGSGSKMGHFSYIGNAKIGENVNIGAGTITCNYDGVEKHVTEIGSDVFLGSDTMLVAPVKVGDGARTGAGSVVTKDVSPGTLVVGVPARAIRKLERND